MKISTTFALGKRSKSNYRHYPLLYIGHGSDGGILTILGFSIIVKL